MTYGQIRLQLTQEYPAVSVEILDGWIQERYTEILDLLSWKRQEAESVFQAPDSYATGTVAATRGSTAVVGTDTVFTTQMSGLIIRIADDESYYQFQQTSATGGTLDRAYEGPTGTGYSFRIDQSLFTMPAEARHIVAVRPLHDLKHPLEVVTPGELGRISPQRTVYGTPRYVAATWDAFTDPPVLQFELFPIPSSPNAGGDTLSWAVSYQFDAAEIDPMQTSVSLLPWVRPAALKEGVRANVARSMKDYAGAVAFEARMASLVQAMLRINALQRGPQTIRTAPQFRRQVPNFYRRGPKHEGYTG